MVVMNEGIRREWIEALESGYYQQGQNRLTRVGEDGTEAHCCLGVLTVLGINAGVKVDREVTSGGVVSYNGESSHLPYAIAKWAGMMDKHGTANLNPRVGFPLSDYNDRGDSFREIAGLLRKDRDRGVRKSPRRNTRKK